MPFDENGKWVPPGGGWYQSMQDVKQKYAGAPLQGPPLLDQNGNLANPAENAFGKTLSQIAATQQTTYGDPDMAQFAQDNQPNYSWNSDPNGYNTPAGPVLPKDNSDSAVPGGAITAPDERTRLSMDLSDIWNQVKAGFQDAGNYVQDIGTQFGQGAANALGLNDLFAASYRHADEQDGYDPSQDPWANTNSDAYNQKAQTLGGTIAGGVGSMAPFILGGGVTDAVAGAGAKLLPGLENTFFGRAALETMGQAALGGLSGAYKSAMDQAAQGNGFDVSQFAKDTGQGALGGAELGAAGGVFGAAGRVIGDAALPQAKGAMSGMMRNAGVAAFGGAGTGSAAALMSMIGQYAQNPDKYKFNGNDMLTEGLQFALTDAAMALLHGKIPGSNAFGDQADAAGTAGDQSPAPSGFKNYVAADQFQNTQASFMTGTRDMAAEGYQEVKPGIWQKPDQPGNYTYEMVPYDDNWLVPKYEIARKERQASTSDTTAAAQKNQSILERVTQYFRNAFAPRPAAPAPVRPQDQTGIVRQLNGEVTPAPAAEPQQAPVQSVEKPVDNSKADGLDPKMVDAAREFISNGGANTPGVLARQFKLGLVDGTRLHDAVNGTGSAPGNPNPTEVEKAVDSDGAKPQAQHETAHDVWNRFTGDDYGDLELNPDRSVMWNVSKNMSKVPHGYLDKGKRDELQAAIERDLKGQAEAPKAPEPKREAPAASGGSSSLNDIRGKDWDEIQSGNPTIDKDPPSTEHKSFGTAKAAFNFAKGHPGWIYRNDDGEHRMYAPDDTRPEDQRFVVSGDGQVVRGEGPHAFMTREQADEFSKSLQSRKGAGGSGDKGGAQGPEGHRNSQANLPKMSSLNYGDRVSVKRESVGLKKDEGIVDGVVHGDVGGRRYMTYQHDYGGAEGFKRYPFRYLSEEDIIENHGQSENVNKDYQRGDEVTVGGKKQIVSIQVGDELVVHSQGKYDFQVVGTDQVENPEGEAPAEKTQSEFNQVFGTPEARQSFADLKTGDEVTYQKYEDETKTSKVKERDKTNPTVLHMENGDKIMLPDVERAQKEAATPEQRAEESKPENTYEKFFFAVNPNKDEIEAIKSKKPDAILLSYANWRPDNKNPRFRTALQKFPTLKALTDHLGYKPEITLDSGGFTFTNPDSKNQTDTGIWDLIDMMEENEQEPSDAANQIRQAMYADGHEFDGHEFNDPEFYKFLQYVDDNREFIDHVMTFDDMRSETATLYAYEVMKELGIKPVPIWNPNWSEFTLHMFVKEHGEDHVAIGGYVPYKARNNTKEFVEKVKPILEKYPNVKWHILGLSDERIIKQLELVHSSDSTYWASGTKYAKNKTGDRQGTMEENIDKKNAMVDRLNGKKSLSSDDTQQWWKDATLPKVRTEDKKGWVIPQSLRKLIPKWKQDSYEPGDKVIDQYSDINLMTNKTEAEPNVIESIDSKSDRITYTNGRSTLGPNLLIPVHDMKLELEKAPKDSTKYEVKKAIADYIFSAKLLNEDGPIVRKVVDRYTEAGNRPIALAYLKALTARFAGAGDGILVGSDPYHDTLKVKVGGVKGPSSVFSVTLDDLIKLHQNKYPMQEDDSIPFAELSADNSKIPGISAEDAEKVMHFLDETIQSGEEFKNFRVVKEVSGGRLWAIQYEDKKGETHNFVKIPTGRIIESPYMKLDGAVDTLFTYDPNGGQEDATAPQEEPKQQAPQEAPAEFVPRKGKFKLSRKGQPPIEVNGETVDLGNGIKGIVHRALTNKNLWSISEFTTGHAITTGFAKMSKEDVIEKARNLMKQSHEKVKEIIKNNPVLNEEEPANGQHSGADQKPVEAGAAQDVQGNADKGNAGRPAGSSGGVRAGSDEGDRGRTAGERPNDGRNGVPGAGATPEQPAADGVGTGETGSVSPDRGGRADSREDADAVHGQREADRERAERTKRGESVVKSDFQITNELDDMGGAKTKFKNNVNAIRTLVAIEAAGRLATPEEQAIIAKYVGWGGLAEAFDSREDKNKAWKKERDELLQMVQEGTITEKEYESMRATTLNAHYTSPEVIKAMYDALDRLGFKGGRVLEPSMGIGNFFGLMPQELAANSKRTGVEIDSLTGRLATQLYQKANIRVQPFEEFKIGDGYFDLAIGNVPFGSYGVVDSTYKGKQSFVTSKIHNYFFVKSLDKVRDGGVVMFVTSSGTMDSRGNRDIRELIGDKADFLGAIRLPGDAFRKNAGTDVTTDIIVLQKRPEGQEPNHAADFLKSVEAPIKGKSGETLHTNEYFTAHPEMVLGEYTVDKLTGKRLGVQNDGRDMTQALQDAMNRLPEGVYKEPEKPAVFDEEKPADPVFLGTDETNKVDEGGYTIIDGRVHQRVGDQFKPFDESKRGAKQQIDRIKEMIPIRDAARDLIRLQMDGATDTQVKAAQKELNRLYDSFVKKYSYLNDEANRKAFDADSIGAGLLRSLETDIKTKKEGRKKVITSVKKQKIFSERTIQTYRSEQAVDTADEALVVSLFEKGRLDFDHMQDLTGKTKEQLINELGGRVYENPNGTWETEDEYLSGNVRKKLVDAEDAAKKDGRYQRNVEALRNVVPADVLPDQIKAKLGTPWLPASDIEQFMHEFLELPANTLHVSYSAPLAKWYVKPLNTTNIYRSTKNREEYGTRDMNAVEIIETLMNQKEPTITRPDPMAPMESNRRILDQEATTEARSKAKMIQDIFSDWLWSDDARAKRLAEKYNWEFNSVVHRNFDGELIYGTKENPKPIPGMSEKFKLNKWQKDAVWRIVQGDNTLLAHVVGAGKTFEMIASGMEMRRLGLAKKPMYIVPNHMLNQFHDDFLSLYPGANVYPISSDLIPSVGVARNKKWTEEEYLEKQNERRADRVAALSKIAVGDYDAIIITHNLFQKFPVSKATLHDYLSRQMDDLEAAITAAAAENGGKDKSVKELEDAKKKLEKRIKDLLDSDDKDIGIPFEELGVDHVFLDEAHYFKNLSFATKMTRVAGLAQRASQRAEDMNLKIQWLTKTRGGRGVTFATGTPISNSVAEMYTMMRYLMMPKLEAMGLSHFDAWAATFGEAVSGIEMDATGRFREKTRFNRFNNVPELMQMFREVADIKTADMLPLAVPSNVINDESTLHVAEMSPELQSYIAELVRRAEALKGGQVDPSVDNWLKLTGDGRKAALDMRMVDPHAEVDDAYSKVALAVDQIMHHYENGTGRDKDGNQVEKTAQLVFLDLGTPKGDSESVSEDGTIAYSQNGVNVKAKEVEDGVWSISFKRKGSTDVEWQGDTNNDMDMKKLERIVYGELHARDASDKRADDFMSRLENVVSDGGGGSFSVYQDIKDRLIKKGIPAKEIAFIHDAKNDDQKAELFEKVRNGDVRVLMGSTDKMGAGTNVQERLIAEHHLDAPWRPSDVEQREGRIIRQGNKNDTVYIHKYTTKGSFDTLMWDILKNKAKFIAQVMNGSSDARSMEDIEELVMNYATVMAATSGNDTMIKKLEADKKYNELAMLKTAHERNRMKWQREVNILPDEIERYEKNEANAQKDAKARKDMKGDKFSIKVGDETFDERKTAGEALKDFLDRYANTLSDGEQRYVGEFGGFKVFLTRKGLTGLHFYLQGENEYRAGRIDNPATQSGVGIVSMLEHQLTKGIDNGVEYNADQAKAKDKRLKELKVLLTKPFDKQGELDEAYADQQKWNKQLMEESQDKPPAAPGEEQEGDSGDYEALHSPRKARKQAQEEQGKAEEETASTATAEPDTEREEEQPAQNPLDRDLKEAHLSPKATAKISQIMMRHFDAILKHTGRMAMSGAEGEYSSKFKVGSVKEKNSYNWRVLGHEIGHAFADYRGSVPGMRGELEDLFEQSYPNTGRVAEAKKMNEGFAEFFRIYAIDPEAAHALAPDTTRIMDDIVSNDAGLSDVFAKVRAIADNDLSGTSFERGIRSQSFMRGSWDDDTYGDEFKLGPVDRFAFNYADFAIPFRRLYDAAAEAGYTGLNPEHLAMITGGHDAQAVETYRSIPRMKDGRFVEGVNQSLQAIEQGAIDSINKAINFKKEKVQEIETKKNGKLKVKMRKRGAFEIYSTMRHALRYQEIYEAEPNALLPISQQGVDAILQEAEEKYPEALELAKRAAQQFSKISLDLQEEAGIITPDIRRATEAKYPNGYYTPQIADNKERRKLGANAGRTYVNSFTRRKDLSGPVLDVFQAQMLKLQQIHAAIAVKRVLDSLVEISKQDGMGAYLRQIRMPAHRLGVSAKEIENWANSFTLDNAIDLSELNDQVLNIFTPGTLRDVKNGEQVVMTRDKQGKPVFLELAPDLYEAVMNMKRADMNKVIKMVTKMAGASRYLSLMNPKYMMNAFFRDLPVQAIQSGTPIHRLLTNFLGSIGTVAGLDQKALSDFIQSGGYGGSVGEVMKNLTKANLTGGLIYTDRPGLMRRGKKFLSFAIHSPRHALRVIEEYPRFNEYISSWKNQVAKLGYDAGEMWKLYKEQGTEALPVALQGRMEKILVEAAYDSRENIIPFQRHGASRFLQSYVPTVPFLKGAINGTYTAARNTKNRKLRTILGLTAVGLMSALSWYFMNKDKDASKFLSDLPSDMRDKYWFLPTGIPGVFMHIDKPYYYALPANMLERFLDSMYGPEGSRKWNDELGTLFKMELGLDHPTASYIETAIDILSNTNSMGGSIVSRTLQGKLPAQQYDANTSAAAIALSQLVSDLYGADAGWSPKYTDYAIQQMFGVIGQKTLQGIDSLMGQVQPNKSLTGLEYGSVSGAIFTGQAQGGSRVVNDFYSEYDKATKLEATATQMMASQSKKLPAGITLNDIKALYYLPTMQAYDQGLKDVRSTFNAQIAQAQTPEDRRMYTMQMNFYEKAIASIMYGEQAEAPNPDANLTQSQIDNVLNFYMKAAQKKQDDAVKLAQSKMAKGDTSKLGPTETSQYLYSLYQQQHGTK